MAVTIEVSNSVVRIMETDGVRVIRWASHYLEMGAYEEESVGLEVLGTAIKQLIASSGIHTRNASVSVSGLYSLSRIIMVPAPPGELPTKAAILEASGEVMPLSEDEAYISWRMFGEAEGGQQVLVVGIPRDVIDNELKALKLAGVNPRVLEIRTMALARAINRDRAIILNMELDSFDVVVVMNSIPQIMRTNTWNSAELDFGDRLEQVATALELTTGFYNSGHPSIVLDPSTPLFITGHMSGDLNLIESLRSRVEYPIEPLAPEIEYPEHLPVSQYAVNIGLALRGMTFRKDSESYAGFSLPYINLLPEAYKPWRPSRRQIYLFLAVVTALVLLIPIYRVTARSAGEVTVLRARYDARNAELERRKVELSRRLPLQNFIAQYNLIVNMGGTFVKNLETINSLADEMGVEVTLISVQADKVTINCQADSYTTFRAFLVALDENGLAHTPSPEGFPYRTGGPIILKPKPAK